MRSQIEKDIEEQKKVLRNQLLGCDFDSLGETEKESVLDKADDETLQKIDNSFEELNNELDPNYE